MANDFQAAEEALAVEEWRSKLAAVSKAKFVWGTVPMASTGG